MGKIVRNNFDISPLNVVQIDGGSKLYEHKLTFSISNYGYSAYSIIINDSPTVFTTETLTQWLYNNGFTSTYNLYPVTGCGKNGNSVTNIRNPIGMMSSNGTTSTLYYWTLQTTKKTITIEETSYTFLEDFGLTVSYDEISTIFHVNLYSDSVREL